MAKKSKGSLPNNFPAKINDGVLEKYYGTETAVEIPAFVRKIGRLAFSDCEKLQSVKIPSSVTEIGVWAFFGCESLQSVEIPASVTEICESAFRGCERLQSVRIPSSVTKIGVRAFSSCESLQSVEIPASVTEIGEYAFFGCKNLKIHTAAGSWAEKYAQENDVPCESVSSGPRKQRVLNDAQNEKKQKTFKICCDQL